MQVYAYRPDAMKMLMGVVFFGFGAAFMVFNGVTDHRAILIDGFIYLAPAQATVFRWTTAVVCGIGAGFGLLALGMALFGEQSLIVGDEAIEIPKSPFSAEVATIPYRTIRAVNLITVRDHRFLKLATARRSLTITEAKLSDPAAFEAIRRAIAAGMAAASGPRPNPSGPGPAPSPQAPAGPANPGAPRSFGRRT